MDEPDRKTGILATIAGFGLGLFAAITVAFIGAASWDIRTTAYASAGALFGISIPVYYAVHYFLRRRD